MHRIVAVLRRRWDRQLATMTPLQGVLALAVSIFLAGVGLLLLLDPNTYPHGDARNEVWYVVGFPGLMVLAGLVSGIFAIAAIRRTLSRRG